MTIDEAIEQEKFKARIDRIKANKRIFHNNDKDEINACNRSAEEHEQIAEWLKELKATKSSDIPIIHGKEELELHDKAIRNKAIDDFVKFANTMPTVEGEDGEIRPMWLEEMAKLLKKDNEESKIYEDKK